MNIVQAAFLAAQKAQESRKELPLSMINAEFHIVHQAAFIDNDGNPATCLTRKFKNVEDIRGMLEQKATFYLYKLYELQEFGMDLLPTGKINYQLRYSVRAT